MKNLWFCEVCSEEDEAMRELVWWEGDKTALPYSCWLVLSPSLATHERRPTYSRKRLCGVITYG